MYTLYHISFIKSNYYLTRNKVPKYARWIEQQPDDRLHNEDCGLIVMGPWGRGRMMDADCESQSSN